MFFCYSAIKLPLLVHPSVLYFTVEVKRRMKDPNAGLTGYNLRMADLYEHRRCVIISLHSFLIKRFRQ